MAVPGRFLLVQLRKDDETLSRGVIYRTEPRCLSGQDLHRWAHWEDECRVTERPKMNLFKIEHWVSWHKDARMEAKAKEDRMKAQRCVLIESGININYYNHVRLPVLKSFNDSNHTLIQNIACHKVPRDSFHPVSWCSIYWLLSYCVILQAMFKNIGNGNVSHLTELTR